MLQNELHTPDGNSDRRKFIYGFGVLSFFGVLTAATGLRFHSRPDPIACTPDHGTKMIKMLTQEGKLVEIDAALLTASNEKITDKELQNWIHK
jgi:hypothetical protein